MEIIDVDYTEVPDDPITETWYTCPSCGCLTHTGEVCSCGYHPPVDVPVQAPVKKRLPSIIIAALVLALACSVFYNAEQSSTNAQLSSDLSDAQLEITAKQQTINNYKNTITSLKEYNRYLQEDVKYMCGVASDFDSSSYRHYVRVTNNPFIRARNSG